MIFYVGSSQSLNFHSHFLNHRLPLESLAKHYEIVKDQSAHESFKNSERKLFSLKNAVCLKLVGLGRLELPTPRLSSVCSNQLSYRPLVLIFCQCDFVRFALLPAAYIKVRFGQSELIFLVL